MLLLEAWQALPFWVCSSQLKYSRSLPSVWGQALGPGIWLRLWMTWMKSLVFHSFIRISIYSWIHLDIHTSIIGTLIIQQAPWEAAQDSYIPLFGNKGQETGRGPFCVLLSPQGGTHCSQYFSCYGEVVAVSSGLGSDCPSCLCRTQKSLHTGSCMRQALLGNEDTPTFSLNPRLTTTKSI